MTRLFLCCLTCNCEIAHMWQLLQTLNCISYFEAQPWQKTSP